jgi:hypothetical protein
VQRGETWERVLHVAGFPTWQAALQFEWRFKQLTRKLPARMDPLERRLSALKTLLALERSTSKAVPYAEWPSPPQVIVELPRLKDRLDLSHNLFVYNINECNQSVVT